MNAQGGEVARGYPRRGYGLSMPMVVPSPEGKILGGCGEVNRIWAMVFTILSNIFLKGDEENKNKTYISPH